MIHIEEFWQPADDDNWAPAFLRAQQSVTPKPPRPSPSKIAIEPAIQEV